MVFKGTIPYKKGQPFYPDKEDMQGFILKCKKSEIGKNNAAIYRYITDYEVRSLREFDALPKYTRWIKDAFYKIEEISDGYVLSIRDKREYILGEKNNYKKDYIPVYYIRKLTDLEQFIEFL